MSKKMIVHEHAIKDLTAERYLLGELNESDREAYEAHLFDCSVCFEQVRLGSEFVGHVSQIGDAEPVASEAHPGFFARLVSGVGQPAVLGALTLMLCAVGLNIYQNSLISSLKGARPESRYVLTGVAHGAGETKLIQVSRKAALSLGVEYTPKGEFTSYQARILSASGAARYTFDMPGQLGTMASIAIPAEALDPGKYSVVISGRRPDGTQEDLGRGSFELQFADGNQP